jgi:hypothetical protein
MTESSTPDDSDFDALDRALSDLLRSETQGVAPEPTVTLTLEIEGKAYRKQFVLERTFPEAKEEPERVGELYAAQLASVAFVTFMQHYFEDWQPKGLE